MKKTLLLSLALPLLSLGACAPQASSSAPRSTPTPSSSEPGSSASYLTVSSDSSFDPSVLPDNPEEWDYGSLTANSPTKALLSDFAWGADLSVVAEVEDNGGVYYNEEGKAEDVFQILSRNGVNYARFRLWNDPYYSYTEDESGNPLPKLSYGGGANDLATDIRLARRAKAAGMKVLLDFHYSDHWADPAKFFVPKAWDGELAMFLPDFVAEWTEYALNSFKANGVTVDSVQIGNESNNGLAGVSNKADMAAMIAAGVQAAKKVFPDIVTLVHVANIHNRPNVRNFLNAMRDGGVQYDVVGLSYYPYWHGGQDNLLDTMNWIAQEYGKPSLVAEISYGWTDEANENCSNTYHSSTFETPGGYKTSQQGQTTLIADVVDKISRAEDPSGKSCGKGIFWWEPAWLPVKGSTWASPVAQYYNKYGTDGKIVSMTEEGDVTMRHYSGSTVTYLASGSKPAWCNQGWFSYTGKALPSASMYNLIKTGSASSSEYTVAAKETSIEATANLSTVPYSEGVYELPLPETAAVVTNLDALRQRPIVWNSADIAAVQSEGIYEIRGLLDGQFEVTCKLTAERNYVQDYSFEQQVGGEEIYGPKIQAPWDVEYSNNTCVAIYAKNEGNLDGTRYLHWYDAGSSYNFTVSQKLSGVAKGDYDFSLRVMGGDSASLYESFKLWYQIGDGPKVEQESLSDAIRGWGTPLSKYMLRVSIQHILVEADHSDVTVGITVSAKGSAWGHSDLWSFATHQEEEKPEEYCADGALEDGLLAGQSLYAGLDEPWIVDADTIGITVDNQNIDDVKGDSDAAAHTKLWAENGGKFQFHQNIQNLDAGEYAFSFNLNSIDASGYNEFKVYYAVEGEEPTYVDVKSFAKGWASSPTRVIVSDIQAVAGKKLTIGIVIDAAAGCWQRMTDFRLTPAN